MAKETKALTLSQKVAVAKKDLEKIKKKAELALAGSIPVEKFMEIAYTALVQNPKLLECDRTSLVEAVVSAAQCGLTVDKTLGEASLIPYGGDCKMVPGYKGLIKLAIQAGSANHINAEVVYEKDEFAIQLGTSPSITHYPDWKNTDRGKVVMAYAVADIPGSDAPLFKWMPLKDIEAIRKRAPGSNRQDSPWKTDYAEMAKKTAVRNLCKYLPATKAQATHLAATMEALDLADMGTAEAPEERDVTPAKPAKPAEEALGSQTASTQGPDTQGEGRDEPPMPTDEDAPAGTRKGNGQKPPAPAEPAKEPAVMATDADRKTLAGVLQKTGRDPREVLEEVLETKIERLADVTHDQYVEAMKQLAPEQLQSEQESFFD